MNVGIIFFLKIIFNSFVSLNIYDQEIFMVTCKTKILFRFFIVRNQIKHFIPVLHIQSLLTMWNWIQIPELFQWQTNSCLRQDLKWTSLLVSIFIGFSHNIFSMSEIFRAMTSYLNHDIDWCKPKNLDILKRTRLGIVSGNMVFCLFLYIFTSIKTQFFRDIRYL